MGRSERYAAWRSRLAIAALSGLCLVPFLVPLRTTPIPSFYAEWSALLVGLLALPALTGRPSVVVPRVAMLPAGLALLLLLQCVWLPPPQQAIAQIALLYLLWALLLMLATTALLQDITLAHLAKWLTLALALAALINACNVILFQAGVRTGLEWLFMRTDRAGNLGQANMLADLLWLGITSALYRWQLSKRGWIYAVWLAPMLVASALTGARAPLLYALWLIVAATVLGSARLRLAAIWVALFYVVVTALVHWLPISIIGGSDSISRMLSIRDATGSSSSIRLNLLVAAGQIALEHPWLGSGWGSFAWSSYLHANDAVGTLAVAEHAHQLFFQLLAELGILVPIFVLGVLLRWVWPIWLGRENLRNAPEVGWAVCAVGVIFLHAQLEYPLWYSHMLGICAVLLVCAEQHKHVFERSRGSALLIGTIMAASVYLLAESMYDYVRLEQWMKRDTLRGNKPAAAEHYQLLAELSQWSLLKAQAVRALAAVMLPTTEQIEAKRVVCQQALHSEPQAPAVFTCALLDAQSGETALAEQRMHQAKLIFGADFPGYRRKLEQVLTPQQLSPLHGFLTLPPEAASGQ